MQVIRTVAELRARLKGEASVVLVPTQPVALSDVAAKAHAVKGVVAADIDKLYRSGAPASEQTDNMLLQSLTGRTDRDGNLLELLSTD